MFISLEGIEGAGKSSIGRFIVDLLRDHGRQVLATREPGGTKLGEKIRQLLLTSSNEVICANTELLLMFAARLQNVEHIIKPALDNNKIVVCDRFTDSSYAYQGGGRGIKKEIIKNLETQLLSNFRPVLTLLLNLPVAIGLARSRRRQLDLPTVDRFESQTDAFFQAVRESYLSIARAEPERVKIIDASQNIKEVKHEVTNYLREADLI